MLFASSECLPSTDVRRLSSAELEGSQALSNVATRKATAEYEADPKGSYGE
jgi:hypothetical protein